MRLEGVGLLVPQWALPWFAVAAAVAFLFGALRLSLSLGMIPVTKLVLAPVLSPLLAILPIWVLPAVTVVLALLVMHNAISFVFGREAGGQFTGSVLFLVASWMIAAPIAVLRAILRIGARLLGLRLR